MKKRKVVKAAKKCCMLGDCARCGHSIMYHVPIGGCLKCACDEFSRAIQVGARHD